MNAIFDLRNSAHCEQIADALPTIDDVQYKISREQFLDALAALVEHLPSGLPLEYRHGFLGIHSNGTNLYALVELGQAFRTLQECDGFAVFLKGFVNPTQFWDTVFEAQVAAYFYGLPNTHNLHFSPPVIARGRNKYPEFRLTTTLGDLLVECKRLHLTASKPYEKFQRNVQAIETAMTAQGWNEEYCLEVEVLRSETEQFSAVVERLVTQAIATTHSGGGILRIDNLQAIVRHRDQPFQMNIQRPGVHMGMLRLPGQRAIQVTDPRYTVLRAFRADIGHRYLKLLRSNISKAQRQLPDNHPAIICIGGFPLNVAAQLFDPHLANFSLPPNIRLLMLWESNQAKTYAREEEREYLLELFGPARE